MSQNAALVEQAAAAAGSLQEQARLLSQAVSRFRLDGADTEAALASLAQGSTADARARLQAPSPVNL